MVPGGSLKERSGGVANTPSPPPPSQGSSLQRGRLQPPIIHFLPSQVQTAFLLAEEASLEKKGRMPLV